MLHVSTFYHSESKSKPGTSNDVVEKRFTAIMIIERYDKYSIGMETVLSKYNHTDHIDLLTLQCR